MRYICNELVVALIAILAQIRGKSVYQRGDYKDRSGYKVLRIHAQNQDVEDVLDLAKRHLEQEDWVKVNKVNSYVDVMASPEEQVNLRMSLREASLNATVLIDDVEQRIRRHVSKRDTASAEFGYHKFNTFESIENELKRIAANNTDLARLAVIGSTHEGRNMYMLRVSHNITQIPTKPIVLIDAGIHAREWVAVSTILIIINQLITGQDSATIDLLNTYEFAFMPVLNPDGYDETWHGDRMWRKNKAPNNGSPCLGVDLNRNWDFEWGGEGTSSNPCRLDFRGFSPFSEKETMAARDWVAEYSDQILVYIDFHTYGQLWMTPYGYSSMTPPNELEMLEYGKIAATAIANFSGTEYIVGPVYSTIYPASSISVDWMRGAQNIPIAFTVELPDRGSLGFLVTEDEIQPIGEETWVGIKAMTLQLASDEKLLRSSV